MKSLTVALALTAGALTLPATAAGLRTGEAGFPGTALPHGVTTQMSCGAVQSLVQRNNHALLTFAGSSFWSGYGTDRIVKDGRYCLLDETAAPAWVQTRDAAACFAGFTCNDSERMGGRGGRW